MPLELCLTRITVWIYIYIHAGQRGTVVSASDSCCLLLLLQRSMVMSS